MKKNILIIIFFTLYILGCEEIPNDVIDQQTNKVQPLSLDAPDIFIFQLSDSSITTSIEFSDVTNLSKVWLNLYSPDDEIVNSEPIVLEDNGDLQNGDLVKDDKKYSAKVLFSKSFSNGKYRMEYFLEDRNSVNYNLGSHQIAYFNEEVNFPPVISNLIMPDTIGVEEPFSFTLKVSDLNGLDDIKKVFFRFYRTDGSVSSDFEMVDNGNINNGDEIAGDGIYSFKNIFSATVKGQNRKFEFQATDLRDSLSNIITHNIYVK